MLAGPCCETHQGYPGTLKYFFSKPYNNYIQHSAMPEQLSCPVHSTAPQNSHGSTTRQLLASDSRNYLQQSHDQRFLIIEWWSVHTANPLGTETLYPVPSHLMGTESLMWKCFAEGFAQARKSGDAGLLLGRGHRIANRTSRSPPFLIKKECCSIHLSKLCITEIPLHCTFHLQILQNSPKRGNDKISKLKKNHGEMKIAC